MYHSAYCGSPRLKFTFSYYAEYAFIVVHHHHLLNGNRDQKKKKEHVCCVGTKLVRALA